MGGESGAVGAGGARVVSPGGTGAMVCGGVAISGMSFMADQDASGSWLGNGGG